MKTYFSIVFGLLWSVLVFHQCFVTFTFLLELSGFLELGRPEPKLRWWRKTAIGFLKLGSLARWATDEISTDEINPWRGNQISFLLSFLQCFGQRNFTVLPRGLCAEGMPRFDQLTLTPPSGMGIGSVSCSKKCTAGNARETETPPKTNIAMENSHLKMVDLPL